MLTVPSVQRMRNIEQRMTRNEAIALQGVHNSRAASASIERWTKSTAGWMQFTLDADLTAADATFDVTPTAIYYGVDPGTGPVTVQNLPSSIGDYVFSGKTGNYGVALYRRDSQGLTEWHIVQLECGIQEAGPTGYTITPTVLTTALAIIPLVFSTGDTTRFAVQPDGSLNVLIATPDLELESSVRIEMVAVANNQEATTTLQFQMTTAGQQISLPTTFPFQSSRTGTFTTTMDVFARVLDLQVGDNIRLEASVDASTTMAVTAQAAVVVASESEV